MWYPLLSSPKAAPELIRSARELLAATSRNLILAVSGILCVCVLILFATGPGIIGLQTTSFALLALVVCLGALRLVSARPVLASALWLTGLAAAIVTAVRIFGEPMLGLLLMLFPLLAIIMLGWPAALVAQAGIVGVAWMLASAEPVPLPGAAAVSLAAGGAVALLLGWATTHTLVTVTQWSLHSYERANADAEDARNQRLELKQVQEDLMQANRELARLSDRLQAMYQVADEARRTKEEFVANVSHELRTPLNMIIGFSEIITRSPHVYGERLPPALLADITAIQRNSQHLARLVNDVLDLSQVDAGRMVLQREWVAPDQIVDDAVRAVAGLFKAKGLYLEAELAADLPSVFCDSTRVRQVLINLLSNAGRFTEQGGVRVLAQRTGDQLEISVIDTGPGISEADRERLFEPFQQLDGSIRRRHGGSGLGLAISKRLVEMHGGKIALTSQVGIGTTIRFSLPFGSDNNDLLADQRKRHWLNPYGDFEYRLRTRPSKAPRPAVPPRYLVLGPGRVLQRLLTGYLPGSEVVGVNSLEQAQVELARSPAQALVVNAAPGSALVTQVQQLSGQPEWRATPVLTCWAPEEHDAATQLGVVRYLIKPVSAEALADTLDSISAVKSVLVVDDQPEALQLFSRMLAAGDRRYDVLQARSGQRGLSLMRQHRPDAVLLDLVMPGMDGFQVLQAKRRDPAIRDIPVVVVSSQDPGGHPIVSNLVAATRGGGLSARELVACIAALSEILAPSARSADPERQGGSFA
jgi:signal transduction histidine kinase/CheY-like chemotaxis protein